MLPKRKKKIISQNKSNTFSTIRGLYWTFNLKKKKYYKYLLELT